MPERRKNARSKLPLDIPLYEQDTDQILGFLSDLSEQGLCINSDEPITQGTELELKMMLPNGWVDTAELDFSAQCCWWENEANDGLHSSGFQIIDINEQASKALEQLLEAYGVLVQQDEVY